MNLIKRCDVLEEGDLYLDPNTYEPCKKLILEVLVYSPGESGRIRPEDYEMYLLSSIKNVIGDAITGRLKDVRARASASAR